MTGGVEAAVTASATLPPMTTSPDALAAERILFEVKRVIVGQHRAVERMLVCLIAGGHCLL